MITFHSGKKNLVYLKDANSVSSFMGLNYTVNLYKLTSEGSEAF